MVLCWRLWCGLVPVRFPLTSDYDVLYELHTLVPTRLFSLKYGASLVWSPEVVDKAILHTERVVDREDYLLLAVDVL